MPKERKVASKESVQKKKKAPKPLNSPPTPNTQAISWFYGEYTKGSLVLQPEYQRRAIWSQSQKCFLIDSIILGCPIPQVYINVRHAGRGATRKDFYDVVDGQQRLGTIIEFINDAFPLMKLSKAAYPYSEFYEDYVGLTYSDLPPRVQDRIWNYPLAVQELRGLRKDQIIDLFRRLNYVVERLNDQELRHSQYHGEFLKLVEQLTNFSIWDSVGLFTRRDSQRMLDAQFVSELVIVAIDGIQGQESLDEYYAKYDDKIPGKKGIIAEFEMVASSLESIKEVITKSRFKQKGDFYTLFAVTLDLVRENSDVVDLKKAKLRLLELDAELSKPLDQMSQLARQYHSTVVEGTNKIAKRRDRSRIIRNLMDGAQ